MSAGHAPRLRLSRRLRRPKAIDKLFRFYSTCKKPNGYPSVHTDSRGVDTTNKPHPFPLMDEFKRHHTYLRISLTDRCNLRCRYCMPDIDDTGSIFSPPEKLLNSDEIIRLATLFVQNGVNKIRLTGGEPTVRKDIDVIIKELAKLFKNKWKGTQDGFGLHTLAMTSNGIALSRKLPSLVQDGLTHLNLSLDTLDPYKFALITRRPHTLHKTVQKVLHDSISLLSPGQYPGLQKVKLNVVIVRGFNDDEVPAFAQLTKSIPLQVRFIEFMPFAGNEWQTRKMVPSGDLLTKLRAIYPDITSSGDTTDHETARTYAIPGHQGSIGFISSMSDHFCSTCNRLRVTADGQIKVCLFDGREISLRDLMRSGASDNELLHVIRAALSKKKAEHGGMESLQKNIMNNRSMIKIGLRDNARIRFSCLQRLGGGSIYVPRTMRCYSISSKKPDISHIDESGRPRMVDVTPKEVTERAATAFGKISLNQLAFDLLFGERTTSEPNPSFHSNAHPEDKHSQEGIKKARIKAGKNSNNQGVNILTVAQLAGTMAAKQTSTLIPLCHPLPLTHVHISFSSASDEGNTLQQATDSRGSQVKKPALTCECTVKCSGRTGVEMEALTGATVALLTVYDMLKAVAGKDMVIGDVRVIRKSGGKKDFSRT